MKPVRILVSSDFEPEQIFEERIGRIHRKFTATTLTPLVTPVGFTFVETSVPKSVIQFQSTEH